jgi:hypothetical protein
MPGNRSFLARCHMRIMITNVKLFNSALQFFVNNIASFFLVTSFNVIPPSLLFLMGFVMVDIPQCLAYFSIFFGILYSANVILDNLVILVLIYFEVSNFTANIPQTLHVYKLLIDLVTI